ncbi:hypothetical protein FMUND_11682 [Fusarium mundagurra]|uniref:Uncharacterized protein n=1 Tax=Fusarium mundagurra TaxID=1567541 RepID=A0A8H6D8I2_9HYPO|nr:hypothetical protein FMUND_11682 [Fusarium mundagurra]
MATTARASPRVSGDELGRQTYVDYIRSCYKNDLEAFSYYEALVDYIEKGSRKYPGQTQHKPRIFELRRIESPIQYPALFPFNLMDWSTTSERPRVVMLEGFPSPEAVVQLAQRWKTRPDDPTLPSRQGDVVRVHFSSLVKSLVQGPSLKLFMGKRAAVEEACRKYEKRLFAEDQYGVTRFRGVNQHDTCCCSIEQTVSFKVVPNKASWVVANSSELKAIYLTDEGTSFLGDVRLPWTSYHNYSTSLQGGTAVGAVPIVPHNKPITSESCDWNIGIGENSMNNTNGSSNRHERGSGAIPLSPAFSQLHPSRNIVVHDEADMELLSEDPFFLLASLFTTSALSFMQLLNYLSVSINEDHSMEVDLLDIKLERLRNCVRIIHRVEAALVENLQWIAQGGCSTWPRARPGMSAATRKQAVQSRLRTDHEALQQKCIVMRQDCELAMAFLVSYSQLLCGERGIAQAEEVARLEAGGVLCSLGIRYRHL